MSEGRAWPVEIRFTPPAPPARKAGFKGRPGPPPRPGSQVVPAAAGAVLRALREERGDILVFLPGAGDIRRVEAALREPGSGLPDGVDLRPLFGALPIADQDAALAPSPPGRRRVVLSTDIAETSLTVDGVRVVVDAGWHRTPRFDPRSGLTRLETVGITKASADQRAGRAGRTEPGVAYRLWSKLEHGARRPFAAPEITTADLSGLVLELAVWSGRAPVPSADPPRPSGLPSVDRPAGGVPVGLGDAPGLSGLPSVDRPAGGVPVGLGDAPGSSGLPSVDRPADGGPVAPAATPGPSGLPFLDPPPARALEEGRRLLTLLGALDAEGRPTAVGRRMAELPLHPRLARMVVGATTADAGDELTAGAVLFAGRGPLACALAALLEDRDVLRGRPDEVETDVAARLRLLFDRDARHPQADGRAVAAARRRATELARRVGTSDHETWASSGPDDSLWRHAAPGGTTTQSSGDRGLDPGPVLALAYPDRIAQARGGARFRLRGGGGGWLPADDPLAGEAFLVVAEMDAAGRGSSAAGKDSRIRLAAALDAADIEAVAAATGATVERVATLSWDPARDDLRARVERRLDSLVLGGSEAPAEPGPATTAALLARVRGTKLGILRWSDAARSLQARAAFAARTATGAGERQAEDGSSDPAARPSFAARAATGAGERQAEDGSSDPAARPSFAARATTSSGERSAGGGPSDHPAWPDLSDAGLLVGLGEWLVPLLVKAVGRADLEAIDMTAVLRRLLGHRVAELERVAPATITFAGGRQVPVDYTGNQPAAEVRVQDAFGTSVHPTVAGVPVVLSLLSPAGRPIQVTADLPGFWNGSWSEVRKDMAGRYPKHPWPPDPATAAPPPGRPPRRS